MKHRGESGNEFFWQGEAMISTGGMLAQHVEDRNRRFNAARRAQMRSQQVFHE